MDRHARERLKRTKVVRKGVEIDVQGRGGGHHGLMPQVLCGARKIWRGVRSNNTRGWTLSGNEC
jgi:hypothetical protein